MGIYSDPLTNPETMEISIAGFNNLLDWRKAVTGWVNLLESAIRLGCFNRRNKARAWIFALIAQQVTASEALDGLEEEKHRIWLGMD